MNRKWTDSENKIIRENYSSQGVIITTRILRAGGFSDREPQSVMRQASKLKVKVKANNHFTDSYEKRRRLSATKYSQAKF